MLTVSSQVLSRRLNISGSSEVQAAAAAFRDEMRAFLDKKKASTLQLPPEQDAVQVMPGHFFSVLSALYADSLLYGMCQHVSLRTRLPL